MKRDKASSAGGGSAIRKKAERLLAGKEPSLRDPSSLDAQALVHELQVHQVELQMQNEQLRQSTLEVEASREQYADLFDFAPIGYFTLNERGLIQEVNLTGAEMLGISRRFLRNAPFSSFVAPEHQPLFFDHRQVTLKLPFQQTCELMLTRKDETRFWVQLVSKALQDGEKRVIGCRMAVTDIREQKEAEEKLRRFTRELEQRVKERTADLDRKNWELEGEVSERRRREELNQALNEIELAIHSTRDFDEIMGGVLLKAVQALGCETAAMSLRQGNLWVASYLYGFPQEMLGRQMTDLEESHAVLAVKTRKVLAIDDADHDGRVNLEHMKEYGIRSVLVIPLHIGGEVIGVLFFNSHSHAIDFTPSHIDFGEKLGASVSLALENSRLFKELRRSEQALRQARNELEVRVEERTRELNERIKELNCLHGISRLVGKQNISLEDALQDIADLLPSGWQHPEITCARILVNRLEFRTQDFRESQWKQGSPIFVHGNLVGAVEVHWPQDELESGERASPMEESALIDAIARQLGEFIELWEAKKELRSAFLHARTLLEASLDPLVTISAEGKIMDVNQAAEFVTGLSREDLIGSDFSEYFTEPEMAREGYQRAFREGSVRNYPLAIRHRSGSITEVLYNATLYRNEAGAVQGIFAAARDVTDRKRAEEEVRRLNLDLEQRVLQRTTQLKAANEELESFAYSISHDLRSPLLAIDGFSKILENRYFDQLDPEGRRILSVIRSSTSRMGQLIDDLLSFSRWGRQEMKMSQIDMAALAKEVFSQLSSDRNIRFHVGLLPSIRADRSMIRQVLFNLLSNALKFSRGKEDPLIEVDGVAGPSENTYYVKDNGVGFDPQYANKLFSVFSRLHRPEEFSGTGVGLAIVKRIVSGHGGKVWAEGALDQGATFWFTLPVRSATKKDA